MIVTNSDGASATNPITITTAPAAAEPAVTPAELMPGTVGQPYLYNFTASGYPAPTFAVSKGILPAGLTLGTAAGLVDS